MYPIRLVLFIAFLFFLTGGSAQAEIKAHQQPTAAPSPFNTQDPYEDFNRSVLKFNLTIHKTVGKPITKAYNALPSPIRTGVGNFFTNLSIPLTFLHDLLQGKGEKAVSDFMRFSINTVFGLGGLLDIATEAGLTYQPEDLGQTLYTWGVWDESSFLMLPILGPYTTREAAGAIVDAGLDPTYQALLNADGNTQLALRTLDGVDEYSRNAQLIDQLQDQPDPYIFVREAYLQHRLSLLYDGHPPVSQVDDIDLDDF